VKRVKERKEAHLSGFTSVQLLITAALIPGENLESIAAAFTLFIG